MVFRVELRVHISALFFQMMEERSQLPVYQSHDHILQVIKESPVTLIRGETGCGKTTQVGLHQSTCTNLPFALNAMIMFVYSQKLIILADFWRYQIN